MPTRTIHTPHCGNCGSPMELKRSSYGLFYGCTKWPECPGTHGAHPDGTPLGVPGDTETRALRMELHEWCERFWRYRGAMATTSRKDMYKWLRDNTPTGHIGSMNKTELWDTMEKLKGSGMPRYCQKCHMKKAPTAFESPVPKLVDDLCDYCAGAHLGTSPTRNIE